MNTFRIATAAFIGTFAVLLSEAKTVQVTNDSGEAVIVGFFDKDKKDVDASFAIAKVSTLTPKGTTALTVPEGKNIYMFVFPASRQSELNNATGKSRLILQQSETYIDMSGGLFSSGPSKLSVVKKNNKVTLKK